MDIYNGAIQTSQSIYDGFNSFILSSDTRTFNKMIFRTSLVYQTIVECGVFKGTGLAVWLKALKFYNSNFKRVIGFDFFSKDFAKDLNSEDKNPMIDVLNRSLDDDLKIETISSKLSILGNLELVKGDISVTSKEYLLNRPGFRISILYLDMDLDEPTYNTLVNFWDRVVSGGYIIFDEYAYHTFSESNGVDRFVKEKKLEGIDLNIIYTGLECPTAYIVKK